MNKKLIVIVLVVLAVAVAGCVGNGGEAPEGDDGNGADNGGSGDDGGDDSDGETADGADGTDDGDDGGNGDDGSGGSVTFREAFGENIVTGQFAFDMESKGDEQMTASGRFHQGNMYVRAEADEGTVELYQIGNDQYVVMPDEGFCMRNPSGDMTPPNEAQVEPGDYESDVSEYPDLTPAGTDTIDGEQVYVYELTSDMTGQSGTVTYYVSVNSGYLLRVDSPDAVVNFHSWGNVEPVEAPDMDCQDMSQGPPPGGM
ncbi:MAG: hypothetical protein U5J64_07420 [Halobacteriales archaeon]|nr:hypothetical protein [Halobacteriales archaeon]